MKIKFKETPEQLELIAAMGSRNKAESIAAQEAFATLLAPTIGAVYNQADTTKLIYTDLTFREDEDPTFPLEIFTNVPDGYFTIWSQAMPGGLPTNTVHQPIDEVRFTIYRLDSTISYLAKYARQTRLPVIARATERLMQEILYKTQQNAWSVVFAALANAKHNNRGQVFAAQTPGQFSLDDYNKLLTFFRRLNKSWVGGTPIGGAARPTDIVVSPEMMEKFRAMAYNPINTKGANGVTPTGASTGIPLPEDQRSKLFSSAGVPEFYGVNVIELLELGATQPYNQLFSQYIQNTVLPYADPTQSGSTVQFDPNNNDLIMVVDASRDFAYRAIQTDADTGSTFTLQPDEQFVQRSGKIGFYGAVSEGRMVLDTRGLVGYVI